ncbi:branched-chain amino acid ABC transporter permease [Rhodoligotrophos defluvii]|uniref:branched-chain amino acid ABC transporter permease n=1 Tax=Rhodoligotrophos defluvii TaxID=2561934 RepID=UPI0010C9CA43|nr:branched-chain amino acid ABC transporter permease [Rhodoligotrophos defluvii]
MTDQAPALPATKAVSGARAAKWLLVALGVIFLVAYPAWNDAYSVASLRDVLIFGLFALSLDYFWGKTGILSFGHATFFGLGAYGMGVISIKLGLDPANASLLGLLGGILLAMLVALVVGYFLIFGGVRGAYLTIVTLALTLIAQHIAIGWSDVTGGDSGLIGVPPLTVAGFVFFDPVHQYLLVLAVALTILGGLWWICRGRYGRILAAIEDNELKARTLGHNTPLHLLVVFVASAGIAALAGALYVTGTGFVAPDMIGLMLSTEVIMWVAVGGRGTLIGPFIGAFVVWRLQQEISSLDTRLWPLFIGLFFIAMVFLFPNGVLSLVERAKELSRRWRGAA